ncbi:MAG: hypothetical protein U0Z17_07475 [Bacteroidales bacterium]
MQNPEPADDNFTDACNNVADEKVITYTWTERFLVKPVISTTFQL